MRGERVDIGGGRRLRIVCAGERGPGPTVIFESGAFGTAATWAIVQDRLAPRLRSCAYDRAGLGYSDPGPMPRDSKAIVADLHALLAAAHEPGPYILVAHSMGPTHSYLFARTYPDEVKGMVLVDGASPDAVLTPQRAAFLKSFSKRSGYAPWAARFGIMAAVAPWYADPIGLPAGPKAEKTRAFISVRHNRFAAAEIASWPKSAEEAVAAGPLDPALPVSVITAGPENAFRAGRSEPARRSQHGYFENVEAAAHNTIMGPDYADAIVRGVDHVLKGLKP
jgi:pimeloyl-ACP methyl ester carboxylesterase